MKGSFSDVWRIPFIVLFLISTAAWSYTDTEEEPSVYGSLPGSVSAKSPEAPYVSETDIFSDDNTSAGIENEPEGIDFPPDESVYEEPEKEIYVQIGEIPKKIYVGQLFAVTLKITALRTYVPLKLTFSGGENVRIIEAPGYLPPRTVQIATLLFQAKGTRVKLPDVHIRYEDRKESETVTLPEISAISLNPPDDFTGVLARGMTLLNYQASAYDKDKNILSLQLAVDFGNFTDFHLPQARQQGFDAIDGDFNHSTIRYTALFPVGIDQIAFSYFNITTNRYERFRIPIIVKRSSVSTQTTLDPQESEFTRFKIAVTIFFILIWVILWWRYGGWKYPLLILLAALYLVTYLIPLKKICIRPGSTVYLLPTPQSTPFLRVKRRTQAKEMGRHGNYVKILFNDKKIGWIRNEDLCQN